MTKGCALSTDYLPRGGLPRNSVDELTDRPVMTSAVDRGRKASTQTKTNVQKDSLLEQEGCYADSLYNVTPRSIFIFLVYITRCTPAKKSINV